MTPTPAPQRAFEFEAAKINKDAFRWFVRPTVKILVVVDGSIGLGTAGFALGKVIDLLESNEFYNWVRFRVTGASREGTTAVNAGADSHNFTYTGFRFNMAGFDINSYDQVWLFGINPSIHNPSGNDDNFIGNAGNKPLSDAELKILAQWMDEKQGGVFATGDHGLLGASMCHRVPRVRNMRRWTLAQGVPSQVNFDRKDTNQRIPSHTGSIPFNAQSDEVPQPIEVLRKSLYSWGSRFFLQRRYAPHEVLCGVDGVIDVLPDHPHEGEALGKRFGSGGAQPVDLSQNFSFDGYSAAEYPNGVDGHARPEPEVIAIGHPKDFDIPHSKGAKDTSPFGLLSVYDGEKAGVGRVLLDSTWHHWFNVNLEGFPADSAGYKKIRNFFKNVAVWLSRKSLRSKMLTSATWNTAVLYYDPMLFTAQNTVWFLGDQARDVLGRSASRCTIREWIIDIFAVELDKRFRIPKPDPCLSCPPWEAFETAVLGGIFKRLSPLVERHRGVERLERTHLDLGEIGKVIEAGVKEGAEAFTAALRESAESLRGAPEAFAGIKLAVGAKDLIPDAEEAKLSIRLNAILVGDPLVAYLSEQRQARWAVEVRINDLPVKRERDRIGDDGVLKWRPVETPGSLVAETDAVLVEDRFREGDEVEMTLLLEAEDGTRQRVWSEKLTGAPSSWRRKRRPDVAKALESNEPVAVWLTIE